MKNAHVRSPAFIEAYKRSLTALEPAISAHLSKTRHERTEARKLAFDAFNAGWVASRQWHTER